MKAAEGVLPAPAKTAKETLEALGSNRDAGLSRADERGWKKCQHQPPEPHDRPLHLSSNRASTLPESNCSIGVFVEPLCERLHVDAECLGRSSLVASEPIERPGGVALL